MLVEWGYAGANKLELIEPALGVGGEGSVYKSSKDKVVFKRYHDAVLAKRGDELEAKIRAMCERTGTYDLAWPLEMGYVQGRFVGFFMNEVDREASLSWASLANAGTRRVKAPGFGVYHAIWAGANLAAAMSNAHERDVIIGDVNESNVLVYPDATVRVIDCDSMQVTTPTRVFRCGVGKAEFTARELVGVNFSEIERTRESDVFALGIMLFMMLTGGSHPFDGITKEETTISERIERGWSPYFNPGALGSISAPERVSFAAIDPALSAVLGACVNPDPSRRLSAKEVYQALRSVGEALEECEVISTHAKRPGEPCRWCEHAKRCGADPFGVVNLSQVGVSPVVFTPSARAHRPSSSTNGTGTAGSGGGLAIPVSSAGSQQAHAGRVTGSSGPVGANWVHYEANSWAELVFSHPGAVGRHLVNSYRIVRWFAPKRVKTPGKLAEFWSIGVGVGLLGWAIGLLGLLGLDKAYLVGAGVKLVGLVWLVEMVLGFSLGVLWLVGAKRDIGAVRLAASRAAGVRLGLVIGLGGLVGVGLGALGAIWWAIRKLIERV